MKYYISCLLTIGYVTLAAQTHFKFEIESYTFSIEENSAGYIHFDMSNVTPDGDSQSSTYFGVDSGVNSIDDPNVFLSSSYNTAFGFGTLSNSTSGYSNTAIGANALKKVTTGNNNTALGTFALNDLITGTNNVAVGKSALSDCNTCNWNIGIGSNSLDNNMEGNYNIAIGATAGSNDTISNNNIYIGFGAGRGTIFATDGYSRSSNTMLGYRAGYFNKTSGNVFLGNEAGKNSNSDNQLYITNSDTDSTETLIYGDFAQEKLRLNSEVYIDQNLGVGEAVPSDKIHINGNGSENLLRIQQSGATKMRIFANGGVAFGGNPSNGVTQNDVYVADRLGVGVTNPKDRMDVKGNIIPNQDNSYELGTATYRWHDVNANEGSFFRATGVTGYAGQLMVGNPSYAVGNSSGLEFAVGSGRIADIRGVLNNTTDGNASVEIHVSNNENYWKAISFSKNITELKNIRLDGDNTRDCALSNMAWRRIYSHAYPTPSDRRIKSNITSLRYGLETVKALNPVSYEYNSDKGTTRLGLIAQELQELVPEAVISDDPERLAVMYDDLIPILIQSIKELSEQKESLEERLTKQEELVQELIRRLD